MQALIDSPAEIRRMENFKRLTLTDLKIDIPRLANKKTLKAALDAAGESLLWRRSWLCISRCRG
jgi:large subunit ribosomal protein L14e